MNMITSTLARREAPSPIRFPESHRVDHLLHRQEYEFLQIVSGHHAQKRRSIELDRDLCELARAHAERELARHVPESILLYLWNSGLRDEQFPGLVKSQILLPDSRDTPSQATDAILGNTADGRHLLAWNKYFQDQTQIGVGYAGTPCGDVACYVFLSATG